MNIAGNVAAAALLLISASSQAARPTSIVFESLAETGDGTPYALFSVNCNDGRSVRLTAWDSRRKWCVGDNESSDCARKQISAARTACMADTAPARTAQLGKFGRPDPQCLLTAFDAVCNDFYTVILEDLSAAYKRELHETFMDAYRHNVLYPLLRVTTSTAFLKEITDKT